MTWSGICFTAGCSEPPPAAPLDINARTAGGEYSLVEPIEDEPFVPGLHRSRIHWGEVAGKPMFIIWSDAAIGEGEWGGGMSGREAAHRKFIGSLQHENKSVFYETHALHSGTGRMRIDQDNYDLADGTLFLVAMRSRPVIVKQVDVDLMSIGLDLPGYLGLMRKTDEIRSFFTTANQASSP